MADPEDYIEDMEEILENFTDQINLIHVCDSTVTDDGLPPGEGDMDIESTIKMISNSSFDGTVVLEVMPEHQAEAFEKWNKYS